MKKFGQPEKPHKNFYDCEICKKKLKWSDLEYYNFFMGRYIYKCCMYEDKKVVCCNKCDKKYGGY